MRLMVIAVCVLALALPSALVAETILRPHDPQAAVQPLRHGPGILGSLGLKVDALDDTLFVPFFEVDTTDPNGTTTLFAVRNANPSPQDIDVYYLSVTGAIVRQDSLTLGGLETLSRNVRDVAGLPVGAGGFARGFIAVDAPGEFLTGDYLQVDVGDDFATGERMLSLSDLCTGSEVRFVDLGQPSELRVLIDVPRGTGPADPPSFTVHVIGEDGSLFPSTDVFTNRNALTLSSEDFTTLSFGTLVFDFANSSGGAVYAEYSAQGRFSVGLNSACLVP